MSYFITLPLDTNRIYLKLVKEKSALLQLCNAEPASTFKFELAINRIVTLRELFPLGKLSSSLLLREAICVMLHLSSVISE